jgi:hypothetical protein
MLVGIAGPARAGKNEAAKALIYSNYDFVEYSFAAPMRQFMISILGLSGLEELDLIKENPHPLLGGKTPRFAMQTLGTEWGRKMLSDSLWVDICINKALKMQHAVISDLRFDNEALAIVNNGGFIIRVNRPGIKIAESSHSSEAGIDDKYVSYEVVNDGSLQEYHSKIINIVEEHIKFKYSIASGE